MEEAKGSLNTQQQRATIRSLRRQDWLPPSPEELGSCLADSEGFGLSHRFPSTTSCRRAAALAAELRGDEAGADNNTDGSQGGAAGVGRHVFYQGHCPVLQMALGRGRP